MPDLKLVLEICDFAAGLLIQIGNYFKIRKQAVGWVFSMIAIVYWIARANCTHFHSQMFWHMVSFLMAFSGFWLWRKDK